MVKCRAPLAYAAIMLVAGCSGDGEARPPPHSSAPVVSNVVEAPPSSQVSPVDASTDLGCSGTHDNPPEDLTIYFDSVALPTSDRYPTALQTGAPVVAATAAPSRRLKIAAEAASRWVPS